MKRTKKLIIITAVLAVLIAVYFVVSGLVKKAEESESEETAAETYALAELSADNLSSVKITFTEDGESSELSFILNDDATQWLWSEDNGVPLDNSAFASMVTALSGATSDVQMSSVSDEKLEEYGLATPAIEAVFGFSDGSSTTYRIGNYNSFNSSYYCTQGNDKNTVYMVSSTVKSSLDVTVEDLLLWDEAPEIKESKITSLTLDGPDGKYVYTYYPTGKEGLDAEDVTFYLSVNGGEEIPVDTDFAEELATALTDISFRECVQYTGTVDDAAYGFDKPITLTVAYGSVTEVTDSESSETTEIITPSTYVLTLGTTDSDGYYYVKNADSQLIYTLYYSDVFESAQPADPETLRYVAPSETTAE